MNAFFPSDAVTIDGEVTYFDSVADSGNRMRRGFCGRCGTPLTSAALERPHLVAIRVGALDHPGDFAPRQTIWTAEAPAWAVFDHDLPSATGQLPPVG